MMKRREWLQGATLPVIGALAGPRTPATAAPADGRATELFAAKSPRSAPLYSVEVVTDSRQTSLVTSCGLRVGPHKTFQQVLGNIDTLLITGGSAIEDDQTSIEIVKWVRKMAAHVRRIVQRCSIHATDGPKTAARLAAGLRKVRVAWNRLPRSAVLGA